MSCYRSFRYIGLGTPVTPPRPSSCVECVGRTPTPTTGPSAHRNVPSDIGTWRSIKHSWTPEGSHHLRWVVRSLHISDVLVYGSFLTSQQTRGVVVHLFTRCVYMNVFTSLYPNEFFPFLFTQLWITAWFVKDSLQQTVKQKWPTNF